MRNEFPSVGRIILLFKPCLPPKTMCAPLIIEVSTALRYIRCLAVMEEELDSSEEGEVSNEEASNESTAFQQHEHMADLFTTSCLDELDYDESVDESENDEPAHLPSHWELRMRRESELVVEDVDAEEGEIMSDEEGEIRGQVLF